MFWAFNKPLRSQNYLYKGFTWTKTNKKVTNRGESKLKKNEETSGSQNMKIYPTQIGLTMSKQ